MITIDYSFQGVKKRVNSIMYFPGDYTEKAIDILKQKHRGIIINDVTVTTTKPEEYLSIFQKLEKKDNFSSYPAYDGVYTNDDNSYMWVKYNSVKEFEAIFYLTQGEIPTLDILPKDWICIISLDYYVDELVNLNQEGLEYYDKGLTNSSFTVITLNDSKMAFAHMLNCLI